MVLKLRVATKEKEGSKLIIRNVGKCESIIGKEKFR